MEEGEGEQQPREKRSYKTKYQVQIMLHIIEFCVFDNDNLDYFENELADIKNGTRNEWMKLKAGCLTANIILLYTA
jgi:hypothetical protein